MVRARAENGERQVRESGVGTRRKWPELEKLQIVRESHRPGAVMGEIARRNGLHPSLLAKWRGLHRDGMLAPPPSASASVSPTETPTIKTIQTPCASGLLRV